MLKNKTKHNAIHTVDTEKSFNRIENIFCWLARTQTVLTPHEQTQDHARTGSSHDRSSSL